MSGNDSDFYDDASNRFRETCAFCDRYQDSTLQLLEDDRVYRVPVCKEHDRMATEARQLTTR